MTTSESQPASDASKASFSWQQENGTMKFQQRLVIIAASSIAVVTYMIFLADVHVVGWLDADNGHHVGIRESPLRGLAYLSVDNVYNDKQVCSALDDFRSETNISIIDLKEKSNYKLGRGGNYILPTLQPGGEYGPNIKPLDVIVMPHSHNDAGWLRTLEEYYVYSTKNILNNMLNKLRMYPNMTFVWAETVFLNIWWNELEDDTKAQVRRLIRNGQLEIVLGGWVMPDEASTHYYSIIDQLMEGHLWVMENLHVKPKNSWSIDPFGHSGAMPYILKNSGLDNMVIQRIHQATKGSLAQAGNLEFLWRQQWDAKGKSDMLCHVMPYMLYTVKHTCGPTPYICVQFDFHKAKSAKKKTAAEPISLKNIEMQAKFLYEQYRRKASLYNYNVILVPLGDDFRYDSAEEWDQQYQNYNMLINYMNSRKDWKINVKFGTLEDYFKLLRSSESKMAEQNQGNKFPSLSGDFFPYSDKGNAYWSGYFTTRPFDKRFSREIEANLRAADILHTLAFAFLKEWRQEYDGYHDIATYLQQSHRYLGLFLHHDAVTGTSKEYVMQDYENKLYYAYNATQKVIGHAAQILMSHGKICTPHILEPVVIRPTYNSVAIQQVIVVEKAGTKVVLFNPLAKPRIELISLVVDTDSFIIENSGKDSVPYQLNPIWKTSTAINPNLFKVVFLVELKPLSLQTVYLYKTSNEIKTQFPAKVTIFNSLEFVGPPNLKFNIERPRHSGNYKRPILLENDLMEVEFSSKNGMLQAITDRQTGNVTHVDLQFMFYKSQGSGAYLFYPNGDAKPLSSGVPIIQVIEGAFVSEINVIFQNIQHRVKIFNHPLEQGRGLHIQNTVDMHANNLRNMEDMEIIMRINTEVQNKMVEFFTDQNGFQLIRRRTDPKMFIEGNYYPMTTMGVLEDKHRRITVHSAQPHGVAALRQGEFEVMLDRELVYDDERGLGEGVQDNKRTVTDFILQVEFPEQGSYKSDSKFTFPSLLSQQINDMLQQPIYKLFTRVNTDIFKESFHPVKQSLSCDMKLVNLRNLVNSDLQYRNSSFTFHRRGYKCGFPSKGIQCPINSQFSFSSLLNDIHINNVRETTLTHMYEKRKLSPMTEVNINPMELATYELELSNS